MSSDRDAESMGFRSSEELQAWQRQQERDASRELPEQHGAPWSDLEDTDLEARFDLGFDLPTIADLHKRKCSAIVARLVKMGKLIAVAGEYRRLGPTFCSFRDIGRPL